METNRSPKKRIQITTWNWRSGCERTDMVGRLYSGNRSLGHPRMDRPQTLETFSKKKIDRHGEKNISNFKQKASHLVGAF